MHKLSASGMAENLVGFAFGSEHAFYTVEELLDVVVNPKLLGNRHIRIHGGGNRAKLIELARKFVTRERGGDDDVVMFFRECTEPFRAIAFVFIAAA